MKKYKVIALSVGGRGNKIYHSGDTVLENNFPEGNAGLLVTQGFLKEIGEGEGDTPATDEGEGQPGLTITPIEKTSPKKLKADLTKAGIEFDPNASKEELYALWLNIER